MAAYSNYKKLFLDENGKWSVGVGTIVRNSPFRGEKVSAFPFPIIDYSSKNLFIRELKAGYHIKHVENPYKGGFFVDGFIGARMRPGDSRRKFSVDAGLKGGLSTSIWGTCIFIHTRCNGRLRR